MKRNLKSAISGLLALGGACLIFTAFANAAPPGDSMDSQSPVVVNGDKLKWDDDTDRFWRWQHDVNYVVGSANFIFDDSAIGGAKGYLERIYAVVKTWQGVRGHIYVDYREETDDGEVFETTYVIEADCLDVKRWTREAWIGGEVVQVTTNFGAPEVGWWIVNKVDDNRGSNPWNPDMHGSSWLIAETCKDRPEPFFWDPSNRGKVIVR